MVLKDTISAPNVKLIIKAVANIIHSLISDVNDFSKINNLFFLKGSK